MKQRGFTLVEILIAVFILAIISVMMLRGLQTVMSAKDNLARNSHRLEAVNLAMAFLQSDLSNLVNRPITAADGSIVAPLQLNSDADQTLDFTRGNLANPLAEPRSTLLHGAYQLHNGQLIRVTWPVLDPVTSTTSNQRVLLEHVTMLQWQFLGADNRFYPTWPATNAANQPLPKAVQISMTLDKWGTITRLFVVNNQVPAGF